MSPIGIRTNVLTQSIVTKSPHVAKSTCVRSNNSTTGIIQVLTIITVIFVLVGLLGGVYGMNFEKLPELHPPAGYFTAMGILLLTATTLLLIFRKTTMALITLRAFVLALVLFSPVATPGAGENRTPPDPAQLSADWWVYFSTPEDQASGSLDQRITLAIDGLRKTKQSVTVAQSTRIGALVDGVIASLEQYGRLVQAKPPVPLPAPVAAETYSLDELLGVMDKLRKARLELDLETQETAQLDNAIREAQGQLSKKKVAYLALPQAAPQRLEMGLDMMQLRLRMEMAALEVRWKRQHQAVLDKQVNALEETLGLAMQRITASRAEVEAWTSRRDASAKRVDELSAALTKAQLAASGTPLADPADEERMALARQKLVQHEVELALAQGAVVTADTGLILLGYFTGTGAPDLNRDRQRSEEYAKELKAIDARFADWKEQTYRSRIAASELIAETSDTAMLGQFKARVKVADDTDNKLRRLTDDIERGRQLIGLLDKTLAQRAGYVGRGIAAVEGVVGESWSVTKGLLTESLFEINETPVTALGLLRVVVILTIAWWLSKLIRTAIMRLGERREAFNASSLYTLGRVIHYVVLIVGVIVGLSSIGIDFTKFALFASALGVGIGFGLQTMISNFVAGLMILFEKSLKVGDFVELENGVTGEVREINMRSTLITTNDNVDILVPNSVFVNGQVTNWTLREAYRRIHVPFGVAYGTDKEKVKKAVLEAADAVPWTLQGNKRRMPQVWFVEFGDSSLNFQLVVWLTPDAVKRPGAVHATYLWEIETKLSEYGIEVPFPQRDLHVRSVFGHKDEEGAALLSRGDKVVPT